MDSIGSILMSEQDIQQECVMLPHFHCDVPVLYLADGGSYVPVIAICQILGIRADAHIPRWRKLLLWATARKLPVYLPKRGKRLVWCLPLGEVSFLYSCFNWQRVSPERREQLLQAAEEGSRISGLTYQTMQQRYKAMRHLLFTTLTSFIDFDANLQRCAKNLAPSLEDEFRLWLNDHIQYGRSLFRETIACAAVAPRSRRSTDCRRASYQPGWQCDRYILDVVASYRTARG